MREEGVIPWGWIADSERSLSVWEHFPNVLACMHAAIGDFPLNPWHPLEPPLVLTETKGNAEVLESTVFPYRCPIAGLKGQSGAGFLRTKIARLLALDRRVLYLGDHDLCGHQIEANTRRVLEDVTGRDFAGAWTRIGLTAEQIEESARAGRPIEPILKIDGRYGDKTPREAWECEALGQKGIVDLVDDALTRLLAQMCKGLILDRVRAREERQRRKARRFLQQWKQRRRK